MDRCSIGEPDPWERIRGGGGLTVSDVLTTRGIAFLVTKGTTTRRTECSQAASWEEASIGKERVTGKAKPSWSMRREVAVCAFIGHVQSHTDLHTNNCLLADTSNRIFIYTAIHLMFPCIPLV